MQQVHHSIIVGSGFSGLCMAIRLLQSGIEDFLILEKESALGGTWRDNHYPGAECDVPSALYSYSFERKTDWDYQWSEQSQILEYIAHVADKHGLRRHIRFDSELRSADYDESAHTWQLTLDSGEQLSAQYLVAAVGQLHKPSVPQFAGAESFAGASFHSARWDHSVDLAGKSVAVIGNAASAVQFVPQIADRVGQLTIYQRSANWLAPKRDKPFTQRQKALMRRFPLIKDLSRLKTYLRNELLVYPTMKGNRLTSWLLRSGCLAYLNGTIEDAALRQKLVPDYPIGAKRILTANGYYEALTRDNVELVTEPVERFDAGGITTSDGQRRAADVVIYATGFVTNPFLDGIHISGRRQKPLHEHWAGGAHAYLGIATHGFPNLFFLYGPNTNLGHNSILLMVEAQVGHVLRAMQLAARLDAEAVEVREDVEASYDTAIQRRLANMTWSRIEASWYKVGERVTNNWPGSVGEYRRLLRAFRAEHWQAGGT